MPASRSEGLRSPKTLPPESSGDVRDPDTLITPVLGLTRVQREIARGQNPPIPGVREQRGETPSHSRSNLHVSAPRSVAGREGCARPEDSMGRLGRTGGGKEEFESLRSQLGECILNCQGVLHIFGIGNQLRGDDAVGLEAVAMLRRTLGRASEFARIHGLSSNPERLISALASRGERIMIIDAVEAKTEPGAIVFARLSETRFGFFATHNIPLRLIPGVAENAADTYLVGIQPDSTLVGEGLSPVVRKSCDRLVAMIAGLAEGRR